MGQIYLVRHGQASFGTHDYDRLSELGVEQARVLGDWFSHCGRRFDHAVSGGLRRHDQTAVACLAAMPDSLKPQKPLRMDKGFEEYDHQEVLIRYRPDFADTDATRRLLAESDNPRKAFQKFFADAMARWMEGKFDVEYRESWPAFRKRCMDALNRSVEEAGASQATVVFTSGGAIAAIAQELLGIPDTQVAMLNFSLVNSAVTKLLHQPGRVSLSYLNNFSHLEQSGRAEFVTYR